jgi:hypothetical protein
MGFFDGILNSAKCLTGFHDWSAWTGSRCIQTRCCNRCPATDRLVDHAWSEWKYPNRDDCSQNRFCTVCSEKEKRKHHVWDVWQHESPGSDVLIRFCRRCPDGQEIKEPNVIIRVPNAELTTSFSVTQRMKNLAPNRKDHEALQVLAESIVQRYETEGGRVENGHRPMNVGRNFSYFTWEWNESADKYITVEWNGNLWREC